MKRMFAAGLAAVSVALVGCHGGDDNAQPGGQGSTPTPTPTPTPVGPTLADGYVRPTAVRAVTLDGVEQIAAEGQVLVTLVEDVTQAQYDAVFNRISTLGITHIGRRSDLRQYQLVLASGTAAESVIAALGGLPGVDRVGYNLAVQSTRDNPAVDAATEARLLAARLLAEQPLRQAQALSSDGLWWPDPIGLPAAWAVEDALGVGSGPQLAVVDTGIRAGQNVIAESRLTRVDASGAALSDDSTSDVQPHGFWVTGFSTGNTADARGVSRFASALSVDVYRDECTGFFSLFGCPGNLGRTFFTDLSEGVRTAIRSSARVVNVSWGSTVTCDATQAQRLAAELGFREQMKPLINLARRLDKLVVLAANNNCEKRDDQLLASASDPSRDSWASHALIVGASTSARKDALFSRMGAVVNLVAPGEAVGFGQGSGNGTSYAAPLVAGSAALLQGIASGLSAPETRYLLVNGAEATLGFAAASTAGFRGYVGADAVQPNRLLNVGNAAAAARLARDVGLNRQPTVALARGATSSVSFDVTVPATGVKALDVVFLIDTTGSYGDDIATLKRQASAVVDALVARGIDVQFAVTAFADFPLGSWGISSDRAYTRLQRMTGDKAAVLAGINALTLGSGSDGPEAQLEGLYQVATGAGRDINRDGVYTASAGDLAPQPVGWRTGAAKVVLFATDANFHNADSETSYPGAGFNATIAALKAAGISVIALQSGGSTSAAADIARLVNATGGASYQLSSDSAQIANAIASGIDTTLARVSLGVEQIAGSDWITGIRLDKTEAAPGETVKVTVDLKGQRAVSIDNLGYDVYLWVRANGSALLQRVQIPIQVAP